MAGDPSTTAVSPKVIVTTQPGYLLVTQRGRHDTENDIRRVQSAVDVALARAGVRRAIFDNRETEAPSEALRAMMWEWVSNAERFEAVALVLQSKMRGARADMTAVSRGVRLRSFDSMEKAIEWIRGEAN